MRKVLFIAYYFPPRGGSGVQRSVKFAKYLPDYGYEPYVITALGQGAHQGLAQDESLLKELPGARIFRTPDRAGILRKLSAHGCQPLLETFIRPDFARVWTLYAARTIRQLCQENHFALVYASLEPWSSALLAARAKQVYGIPLVLDFRDPWTQRMGRIWPSRLHYCYDAFLERKVVKAADDVIAATPGVGLVLEQSHPDLTQKVRTIYNGYDADDVPTCLAEPPGANSVLQISYAGTLENWNVHGTLRRKIKETFGYRVCSVDLSTHSPLYLLRAIEILLRERPELRSRLRVSFAGRFGRQNKQLVKELGLDDIVQVLGYLRHAETMDFLRRADVLFLPMLTEHDGRRSYNASGKIFEYMALRRPILAAVPEGDAAEIVRKAQAGWVVNPHGVSQIKAILAGLLAQKTDGIWHTSHNDEYIQRFERRILTGQLARVFDDLTSCQ